jgi:hypothetical protein
MAMMGGSSAAEVDAPLEQVRAFVQDVERAPQWQGGLMAMRALERDVNGYLLMVSVSSVTAPVRASTLPAMVTPVVTVIEARAITFPLKKE